MELCLRYGDDGISEVAVWERSCLIRSGLIMNKSERSVLFTALTGMKTSKSY